MELTHKDANFVTLGLEPREQNLFILSLMFAGVPTKGGISKEGKNTIFAGSQGVYIIRNTLDPHGKQRVERNKLEREEARKRGEKWKRKGADITGPIYAKFTRGDVISLKRLFDIVATNEVFIAQMKNGAEAELVRIRDELSDLALSIEPN
jgi:hypothetical protein